MRPLELFMSRKFSYGYLVSIWGIWLAHGVGPLNNCVELAGGLGCIGGIWPEDIYRAPLRFISSLLIGPIFHNSPGHILFVTTTFFWLVQSFEVRAGAVRTLILFLICTAIAATLVSVGMVVAGQIWPDHSVLSEGLARAWMGGSAGMFGIIGASSYQSRRLWVVPAIAVSFETWNHFVYGTSLFTSLGHMVALTSGFFLWGWWIGNLSKSVDSS
jgi:hypothetical protein